jgi:hypothetical protein
MAEAATVYDELADEIIVAELERREARRKDLRHLLAVSDNLLGEAEERNRDGWPPSTELIEAIGGLADQLEVKVHLPGTRQAAVDVLFEIQEQLLDLVAPGWPHAHHNGQEEDEACDT